MHMDILGWPMWWDLIYSFIKNVRKASIDLFGS